MVQDRSLWTQVIKSFRFLVTSMVSLILHCMLGYIKAAVSARLRLSWKRVTFYD